jgi:hypothetical protein
MVRWSILLSLILSAAVTTAAQTPAQDRPAPEPAVQQAPQKPAPAQQPSAPAPEKSTAANKATYTGCLKPGTTPGSWILESAESAAAASAPVGTSGAMKTTLSLSAKPGTDLKPHANHKIEVVGTVAPAKPSSDPAAAPSAPRQELTVESLKMVAATCP